MFGEIRAIQPFFVSNTTQYYKKMLPHTPYVHFYSFTANTANTAFSAAVPDGCADILFEFCDGSAKAHLYGFVTERTSLQFRQGADYFGVRFRPGFLPGCLGISLPEIVNTRVSLKELPCTDFLTEKIARQPGFHARMEIIFAYFGECWSGHELLWQFLDVMNESTGAYRVGRLEEKTLYSTRYIRKVFKENMGISPKSFARYARLQQLITAMNNTSGPNISGLAADFGYFDQAHLYKEFKQLTSLTPGEYFDVINVKNYNEKFIYV